MKFRDRKTGETWNAGNAAKVFCDEQPKCNVCPLFPVVSLGGHCRTWSGENPCEAARLMGFEMVEDDMLEPTKHKEEANTANAVEGMCCDCAHGGPCCSWDENEDCRYREEDGTCWVPYTKKEVNMDKPRICEVLGVEVGERFSISPVEKQLYVSESGNIIGDDGHLFAQLFVDAINHPDRIIRKPRFTQQEVKDAKAVRRVFGRDGTIERYSKAMTAPYSNLVFDHLYINEDLFPSIKPGQSVTLEEIIGSIHDGEGGQHE